MSITPFSSASGGFTNISSFPDIPPNSAAMRAQMEIPSAELGNYINGTLIPAIADISGWTLSLATFSYTSADAPNFIMASSIDVTANFYPAVKVRLTQDAITKYFIVMASLGTAITLYGGTDYTLTSSPITNVSFSNAKAPFGFPLDPNKWSVILQVNTNTSLANLVAGTLTTTGLSLPVPIGGWNLSFKASFQTIQSIGTAELIMALSSSVSSITDLDLTASIDIAATTGGFLFANISISKVLTSKTTYTLIVKSVAATTATYIRGDNSQTILKAVCAYL